MDGTEIGRVEKVTLAREDHGILTCFVYVRFRSGGQAYGGFALDGPTPDRKGRSPSRFAGAVLLRMVDFFGGNLDNAPSTPIAVTREGGMIRRIARLDCDGGAVLDFKALAEEFPS